MLNRSCAVTLKAKPAPAVAAAGAPTAKWAVAAGLTVIGPLAPLILLVAWSVAVSVWLPAVVKVALNAPTPALSVLLAGREAWASLLVKVTVPA